MRRERKKALRAALMSELELRPLRNRERGGAARKAVSNENGGGE